MRRLEGLTAVLEAIAGMIGWAKDGQVTLLTFDEKGQELERVGPPLTEDRIEFGAEGEPIRPDGHEGGWACAAVRRIDEVAGYLVAVSERHLAHLEPVVASGASLCSLVLEKNYELDDLSDALGRFFEERMFLYEITTELAQAASVLDFCQRLAERIAKILHADRSYVVLKDNVERGFRVVGTDDETELRPEDRVVRGGVTAEVLETGSAKLIEDLTTFDTSSLRGVERYAQRSLLVVPICGSGSTGLLGALGVMDGGSRGSFTFEEERLLQFIAEYLASLLTGIQLVELAKEMQIAERIVQGLLPAESPTLEGVEVSGRLVPARTIGGDYYDFIPLGDGALGVVIADVSGHTLPAALMMAVSRSGLRWTIVPGKGPDEVLRGVAYNLYDDLASAGFFMSLCLLILEPGRRVRFSNAGHPAAIHYRARTGEFIELDADGMVAGVCREVEFQERVFQLEDGDLIVLYTDGVIEAGSPFPEEQFGSERLKNTIAEVVDRSAEEVVDHIFTAVQDFAGSAPTDDVTVVALQAKPVPALTEATHSEVGASSAGPEESTHE